MRSGVIINNKNIMLLGIPRSGTTLGCHLINKLPNAVALHEPFRPKNFSNNSPSEVIRKIEGFINIQRFSLLENGTAVSKTIGGKVPDNHLRVSGIGSKKRVETVEDRVLLLSEMPPKDFFLVIKHCSFFVGILEFLVSSYNCFAIVRNPLSTLLSWNSVELQVTHGYAPAAESFDNNLKTLLYGQVDSYKRQMLLLTWFYNKLYKFLPRENIILYEDIISSGGSVLGHIIPEGKSLSESLYSKNNNPLYDNELKHFLAEKLLSVDHESYLHFYSKEDILRVLDTKD